MAAVRKYRGATRALPKKNLTAPDKPLGIQGFDIDLKEVHRLARLHMSKEDIATKVDIDASVFEKLLKSDKRVARAYSLGRADFAELLRTKQINMAGESSPMAIHLGRNYLDQDKDMEAATPAQIGIRLDDLELARRLIMLVDMFGKDILSGLMGGETAKTATLKTIEATK